ncbi:MAG TPA: hypothetical protein VHC96_10335, partial [Puia sp.]|nr:hypothetical protein [Puia sp.]
MKRFKFLHWLYNLIHYRSLSHNRAAYRAYKVQKPLIASISSKDFPDKTSRAWLDTGHSRDLVPTRTDYNSFPPAIRQQLLTWSDKGYLIWKDFFDSATADRIQQEVDNLAQRGKLHPTHDNKLMFANRHSTLVRNVTQEKKLTGL